MKKMVKVIMAAAAVVALAVPALAADKLIVKDAAGTANVFSVDDAGTVLGKKLGMGTSTPQAPLHLNLDATKLVGTALYNVSSGLVVSRGGGAPAADFTAAADLAGQRGQMRGVRARGTLESPTAPILDDQVFSLLAGVYVGPTNKVWNAADIVMKVDGTLADNADPNLVNSPVRIVFQTRPLGYTWYERFIIKADGKIMIPSLPVYADNTAAASLAAGTVYRTATGVLMIKY